MKKIMLFILLAPLILTAGELQDVFENPPESAKPRGYWVWPHGNFDYEAIKHDLREFKAKGLGGVDVFDLGITDPGDVIPAGPAFMSPEQVDGIAFALTEAKKLGLKMGLIVSSSWNAGASWTPPEQAAMNLVASMDTVQGPIRYQKTLPFPALPDSFYKSYGTFALHVPKEKNGLPRYYQDIATLIIPLDESGVVVNREQIKIVDGSAVDIELAEGEWLMLRAVCTNFGQMLWVPSDNSHGLSIDHFSKQAVTDHFKTIINRLQARVGPLNETSLERFYLASYESNAEIIWTPTLSDEFYARNGYRIEPFIPALFGVIIEDKNITERFLYDFRKTTSDVFVDNLYRNARDICHDYGLKICSEAGGPGAPLHDVPTEDLLALGALDVMRGEFWVDKKDRLKPDGFEELQIVKGIASAAHIYGHTIVEMEAFTSHDNWRQSPAALKPFADRAFCEGMNRVVYHTMSHNLPEAGKPGWSFGAGTHVNTNTTWWDMSNAWHQYITRCSAMLQQGQFVADACFYYGHDIPNFTQPKHARPGLGHGYDYDDINTEVLLMADVQDGRIVLPGGMSYPVLILPEDERMDLAVIKKIRDLLFAGATIIGLKPSRIYGLADYQQQEEELREIAENLWGRGHRTNLDKKIGAGRLAVGTSAREILLGMGIGPDAECLNAPSANVFDYIHRQTENADIYFVRNTTADPITIDVRFRIVDKQPELWDPVSGTIDQCAIFIQEKDGIRVPLNLDPNGSLFVIFKESPIPTHIVNVRFQGTQIFPSQTASASRFDAKVRHHNIEFTAESPGDYEIELNNGNSFSLTNSPADTIVIGGPWDVSFPHGWEARQQQKFARLISWTESDDPGTRAFSGTATYRTSLSLSEEQMVDRRFLLDLGQVIELAQVYLNGHDLGISNFAPHQFDVTDVLRAGDNFLVVKVTNTWLNRLIEDDKRPENERLTHTNLTRGPTSATAWREAKPRPSGLLGPVRIMSR